MNRDRAGGEDAQRLGRAEKPAGEIDVVDAAVEEDAAAGRCEAHEKTGRIVHVEVLRAHQERRADEPGLHLGVGVAVARIEAPAVADHHLELRVLRGFGLDTPAFREVEGQGFFAEHMLACLQAGDDVAGMKRSRRDQEHGVDVVLREHRLVVRVEVPQPERISRPVELFGERTARGDEFNPRHALGEILRMAAEARARGCVHSSTIRFSRQDVVAASASSSALTPSSIDVLTGERLASASKKCAISLAYAFA